MSEQPNQPLTREQYAAALSELDEMIEGVDTSTWDSFYTEGDKRVESAVLALTVAVLAVAKGIRLLAEPPPVDMAEPPSDPNLLGPI